MAKKKIRKDIPLPSSNDLFGGPGDKKVNLGQPRRSAPKPSSGNVYAGRLKGADLVANRSNGEYDYTKSADYVAGKPYGKLPKSFFNKKK